MEQQNQQPQPPEFNQPQQPAAPQYQPRVFASPIMDPVTAVKTCFKKFFTFTGRARRSEYWWFVLFVVIVSSVLTFLSGLVPVISYLSAIFGLVMIIPQLSALTRRLHDTNRSGWWVLLFALCFLGYYGSLGYMVAPSLQSMADVTDSMEMAAVMVDSIQSSPIAAGIMICCALGVLFFFVITLIFAIIDSKWDANKYGPSPKYQ